MEKRRSTKRWRECGRAKFSYSPGRSVNSYHYLGKGSALLTAEYMGILSNNKSTLGKYLKDIIYMFTEGHLQECL